MYAGVQRDVFLCIMQAWTDCHVGVEIVVVSTFHIIHFPPKVPDTHRALFQYSLHNKSYRKNVNYRYHRTVSSQISTALMYRGVLCCMFCRFPSDWRLSAARDWLAFGHTGNEMHAEWSASGAEGHLSSAWTIRI